MGSRRQVLVVDRISPRTKELSRQYLTAGADIFFEEDLDSHLASADVLITATKGISVSMLEKAQKCIYIQKYGIGVNNIAIPEATRRGIPVGNTAGQNARSVAEHTVLFMLAAYRNIITAHTKLVNEGKWLKAVLRDRCYQLTHKKVGIIGLGNIGRNVATLLRGFECELLYHDIRRLSAEAEAKLEVVYAELDTLIKTADVVTLHVPLTDQTRHLINKARLEAMKPTAVLVNTSRGGVVDEKALIEVLHAGHLLGVALDVFETEPINQAHPLTKFENVVLTPHNAAGTNEAIEAVVRTACRNINSMLQEGRVADPEAIVNWRELISHDDKTKGKL